MGQMGQMGQMVRMGQMGADSADGRAVAAVWRGSVPGRQLTALARLGHCGRMDLRLRFTEAETSLERPNVAAFAAVDRALLGEQAADHDDTSVRPATPSLGPVRFRA